MSAPDDLRFGGPCRLCGQPQHLRAAMCPRTRSECSYGKDPAATPDPALIAMVTQLVPKPKPTRLARMLRLYVAANDGLSQKQIAAACEMSESTLSRFISGEQLPDSRAFLRLITWCFGEHEDAAATNKEPRT